MASKPTASAAYLYAEYHKHEWHMPSPDEAKKTTYQYKGRHCSDPEGPDFVHFVDLQSVQTA